MWISQKSRLRPPGKSWDQTDAIQHGGHQSWDLSPLRCRRTLILRSVSLFSSKEHTGMEHVSFHVLSQVGKQFSSERIRLHSFLFVPGATAYLFREALYRPASVRYMAELWIHKWQIGSNCQPRCPKGSRAVSPLLSWSTLLWKTRTERVDGKDGASLLWFRGNLPGASLGDLQPSLRPCLKQWFWSQRDTSCVFSCNQSPQSRVGTHWSSVQREDQCPGHNEGHKEIPSSL